MWDAEMSERQAAYLHRLLDERIVTPRMAEELIRRLEDSPRRNADGLSTEWVKPERPLSYTQDERPKE